MKQREKNNSKKTSKKRTVFRILLLIIACLFIVTLIIGIVRFISLKKERDKALDQGVVIEIKNETIGKIDLVGLLDSYGVPYNPSVNSSFFDLLKDELDCQGLLGSNLDLFNLYINKTWHVNGIFNNRVTINEMIEMKNFALDFVRYKYGDRVKETLHYEADEETGERAVFDYVANLANPVIVYSSSANDLFYYFGSSLESLTLGKTIEILRNMSAGLDFLESNVKGNIDTLLNCNSKCQIFVMGLYLPSGNFILNRLGSSLIQKINDRLAAVCNRYDNVYFVDVSAVCFEVLEGDFHPNQNGHLIMANKLARSISDNLKPVKEYAFDNLNEISTTTNQIVDVDVFVRKFKECTLPMRNYLEYSTAIEWVLHESGYKDASWKSLAEIEADVVKGLGGFIDIELFQKGYNICVIEHKILEGTIEAEHSLHPSTKKNDKIGLITYYK